MVNKVIKEFTVSLEELNVKAIEYRKVSDDLLGNVLVDSDILRQKLRDKARKSYVDPK